LIASKHADVLRSLNELVDASHLKPLMGRCLHLAEAADAVADLDARRTRGRLALTT
jgi:NADPH:quinone reductase-like Zn-dependent oxidoreductase